jgi:hypothetical protein
VVELAIRPEAGVKDTAINILTMLADLAPLVMIMLPSSGCGPLPVGTQMAMLAAALLSTMVHILDVLLDITNLFGGLIVAACVFVYHLLLAYCDCKNKDSVSACLEVNNPRMILPQSRETIHTRTSSLPLHPVHPHIHPPPNRPPTSHHLHL